MSLDNHLTELNAYNRAIKDFSESDLATERRHHIGAAVGSVVLTAASIFVGRKFADANPYTFFDYVGGWTSVLLSTGAIANTLVHTIQATQDSWELRSRTDPNFPN